MPEEFRKVIPRSFEECKKTIMHDLHFTYPHLFTFRKEPFVRGAIWGRSYFISEEEFCVEMQGTDLVIEGVLSPLREDLTEVTGQVNVGGKCIRYNFLVPFLWIAMLTVFLYISDVSLVIVIILTPIFLALPFAFCHIMMTWHSQWIVRNFIESLQVEV